MKIQTKRLFDEARREQAKGNTQAAIGLYREAGKESAPARRLSEILIGHLEQKTQSNSHDTVDIIVPVFNAGNYAIKCINSIFSVKSHLGFRLIVVNDGSDKGTTIELENAQNRYHPRLQLIHNKTNLGYTKSVNIGLRESITNYIAILNSDTIVCDYWLDNLVRCINSHDSIGIAGPLSNAASYQTVPSIYDERGFCTHEIEEDKIQYVANAIHDASRKVYPRVPIVNGFCYMIKREVINEIGILDEESFPIGYGEENDFCLRAIRSGFAIAVADDTYVYHFKSKTFGASRKKELSRLGREHLIKKHGIEALRKAEDDLAKNADLDKIRSQLMPIFQPLLNSKQKSATTICFVLPVKGGGGGAHSVVQEVNGLRKIGIDAYLAVKREHVDTYVNSYPSYPMRDILVPLVPSLSIKELSRFDIVVATIYQSALLVSRVNELFPWILPCYYVQDYEPLFCKEGSSDWNIARESYTLNSSFVCFAKTDWICQTVFDNHGVRPNRVTASIDRDLYFPRFSKTLSGPTIISAMVRPSTPRRAAGRTIEALSLIKKELGNLVEIHIFGCSDDEVPSNELGHFYTNHGKIKREQVANILRDSTLFVDFSDYQAFGRTGLEAMACGCIPLLPILGGTSEYAEHNVNSLVVDTMNVNEAVSAINNIVLDSKRICQMRNNAIKTATKYSISNAVISEAILFSESLECFRSQRPNLRKTQYLLAQEAAATMSQDPYYHEYLLNYFGQVEIQSPKTIPLKSGTPDSADTDIICIGVSREDTIDTLGMDRYSSCRQYALSPSCPYDVEHIHPIVESHNRCIDATIWASNLKKNSLYFDETKNLFYFDIDFWKQALDASFNQQFNKFNCDKIKIGFIGCSRDAPMVSNIIAQLYQVLEPKDLSNLSFESIGVHQHFKSETLSGFLRIGLPKQRSFLMYSNWLKTRLDWDAAIVFPSTKDSSLLADAKYRICQYGSLGIAPILYGFSGNKLFDFLREGSNVFNLDGSLEGLVASIRHLLTHKSIADAVASTLLKDMVKSKQIKLPNLFALISPFE